MRALLIAASVRQGLRDGIDDGMPKKIANRFGVYPHLGLCHIASALRDEGIEVQLLDQNVENLSTGALLDAIERSDPDIIGISCMTFTFLGALKMAWSIRGRVRAPIVFGGNHPSIYPKEVLAHDCVDVAVIGEGERTFVELCRTLQGRRVDQARADLAGIEGIAFRAAGTVTMTAPRPLVADVDDIAPPAYDLLRPDRYYGCNLPRPYMTMITARGCPNDCSFCSRGPWGRSYRPHGAARVVDELEQLVKGRGVKAIDFFDDTFIVDHQRVVEIAEGCQQRQLRFEFGITTRVNSVNRSILGALKRMGCTTIAYGVESGDPDVLRRMDKRITLAQVKNAFRWAKDAGINTVGFFLVGAPGEDRRAYRNTLQLIRRINPDYFIANVLVPYPGSRLYAEMLRTGRLQEDYWARVTREGRARPTPLANEFFSRDELIALRNRVNRMPYLRLRTNIVKLKKIRTVHDLGRAITTLKTALLDRTM